MLQLMQAHLASLRASPELHDRARARAQCFALSRAPLGVVTRTTIGGLVVRAGWRSTRSGAHVRGLGAASCSTMVVGEGERINGGTRRKPGTMVMMVQERPFTMPEVAKKRRVSTRTVLNYLRADKINGRRLSGTKGSWRIPESSLQRFIDGDDWPASQ
jgi:hypothetical protein